MRGVEGLGLEGLMVGVWCQGFGVWGGFLAWGGWGLGVEGSGGGWGGGADDGGLELEGLGFRGSLGWGVWGGGSEGFGVGGMGGCVGQVGHCCHCGFGAGVTGVSLGWGRGSIPNPNTVCFSQGATLCPPHPPPQWHRPGGLCTALPPGMQME